MTSTLLGNTSCVALHMRVSDLLEHDRKYRPDRPESNRNADLQDADELGQPGVLRRP